MKQNLSSIIKVINGILKTEEKWGKFVPLNLQKKKPRCQRIK